MFGGRSALRYFSGTLLFAFAGYFERRTTSYTLSNSPQKTKHTKGERKMKRFLSFVLALILVMSMVAGMVSCDTTDDPSDTTQTGITELEEAKTNAKSALDSYVNAEDYRDSEKTLLETTIANGKTAPTQLQHKHLLSLLSNHFLLQ